MMYSSITKDNRDSHSWDIFHKAELAWDNLSRFRKDRKRCMRYTYGDQLSDMVRGADGRMMREEDMIRSQGGTPVKVNQIRKLVNTIKGLYISQSSEAIPFPRDREEQFIVDGLAELLKTVNDINDSVQLYSDMFEEFLISGFVGCRKTYRTMQDRLDVWTNQVQADNFFVDAGMTDYRCVDCNLVGEIHDISWGELLMTFAKSAKDIERLKNIYHYASDEHYLVQTAEQFGYRRDINTSFLLPTETNACRVIEVWNKEYKDRYRCVDRLNGEMFKCDVADAKELVDDVNLRRVQEATARGVSMDEIQDKLITKEWFIDNYWYYRFFAPTGEVISEGESPYYHKEHPFVFRFFPFVNQEIHSVVSDVVDIQRNINSLLSLYQYLLKTGAKGLLAIPDSCLEGTGLNIEDIADVWAKPGGIFVYHAKPGVSLPQQITSNMQNVNITQLVSMMKDFFDDGTGVNGALQGKPQGTISGSYYAQQAQNSALSLQGVLTAYNSFIKGCALKDCKLIQQYYDTSRIRRIIGRKSEQIKFNPKMIECVEYDISISQSQSSPVYNMIMNEFLMEVFRSGQIDLETLLEVGTFPNGDKLLGAVRQRREEQAQQQAAIQEQMMMQQGQMATTDAEEEPQQ